MNLKNPRERERRVASQLGNKIRERRKQLGLTLDQLSERTNSSKSYIWELEHKDSPRPSAEKLAKIAAELGVTPEFLVNEARITPDPNDQDEAFFRKYQLAKPDVKDKLKKILNVLDEDDTRS